MAKEKFNTFSVPLGLLDYGNPILYTITMVTLIRNLSGVMGSPYGMLMKIGAVISIFFGFIIPTGKVIVGLGIIKFVMPVSLVFCVNAGILITGLMLFRYVMKLSAAVLIVLLAVIIALLGWAYSRKQKINTVAVLTGAVGYLLIYISLITLSVQKGSTIPIVLYAVAIMLYVMLCGIGIRANLMKAKMHWILEASNVLCQLSVAAATVILFS